MKRKKHDGRKPYQILGAGPLVSSVWKQGDESAGWQYGFNIFRMSAESGDVARVFSPGDVIHLVRLCQVLAAVLAEDGCLAAPLKRELSLLALLLDPINQRDQDADDF